MERSYNKLNKLSRLAGIPGVAFCASLILVGCGPNGLKKDPMSNYENNKLMTELESPYKYAAPTPPAPIVPKTYSTITSMVQFQTDGTTVFVQGKPHTINISVVGPIRQQNVNYKLMFGNSTLSSLNAKLVQTAKNDPWDWQLQWTPPTFLTADQPTKEFQVPVQFVLTGNNPASVKAEFASQTIQATVPVTLAKYETVPIVQDVTPKNIKVDSSQDVTIDFTVLAKGYDKPSDITADIVNGPDYTNDELPLYDGQMAALTQPKLVKTLGVDPQGYTHFQYEFVFSGSVFAQHVYKELNKNWHWKWYLANGKVHYSEAQFSIEARNLYNHNWSANKTVTIYVNLNAQAGKPELIAGAGISQVQVTAGETALPAFLLGTRGGKGALTIESAKFDGKSVNVRGGQARIQDGGLDISLNCHANGINLNQQVNCHTGACVQTCTMQVDAGCSQAPVHDNLVLNTKSVLGSSSQTAEINLPIAVTGRSNQCTETNSAKASHTTRAPARAKGAKS